jgi:hypothetical protein
MVCYNHGMGSGVKSHGGQNPLSGRGAVHQWTVVCRLEAITQ